MCNDILIELHCIALPSFHSESERYIKVIENTYAAYMFILVANKWVNGCRKYHSPNSGLELLPVCKIAGFPGLDYSESIIDGKGIRFSLRFLLWLGCYWDKSSYNSLHTTFFEAFLGVGGGVNPRNHPPWLRACEYESGFCYYGLWVNRLTLSHRSVTSGKLMMYLIDMKRKLHWNRCGIPRSVVKSQHVII